MYLEYKTSFGGDKSRIDNWPFSDPADKGLTWLRLAIGYKDTLSNLI